MRVCEGVLEGVRGREGGLEGVRGVRGSEGA